MAFANKKPVTASMDVYRQLATETPKNFRNESTVRGGGEGVSRDVAVCNRSGAASSLSQKRVTSASFVCVASFVVSPPALRPPWDDAGVH